MTPPRKKLPHDAPLFVKPEESLYFVTICSANRGSRELLETDRASKILDAALHRHKNRVWYARVFVVMPDHIHALLRFPHPDHPMRKAILDFKRWTARSADSVGRMISSNIGCGRKNPPATKRITF